MSEDIQENLMYFECVVYLLVQKRTVNVRTSRQLKAWGEKKNKYSCIYKLRTCAQRKVVSSLLIIICGNLLTMLISNATKQMTGQRAHTDYHPDLTLPLMPKVSVDRMETSTPYESLPMFVNQHYEFRFRAPASRHLRL